MNNLNQAFFYIKLGYNKCYFNYVVYSMKCGVLVLLEYNTLIVISQIVWPTPTFISSLWPTCSKQFCKTTLGTGLPENVISQINVNPQKTGYFMT